MRTMTKGNEGILIMSAFQLWRQVFLDTAAETRQAAEEAEKREAAMRQAQRLVFAASGALMQDTFREWHKLIEQMKQKLEAQKQMLTVMGSGQSVMILGTTFSAWAKVSQDEKKRMKRMKELQKKFLDEDQTRIETAFMNWSKAYLEAKKRLRAQQEDLDEIHLWQECGDPRLHLHRVAGRLSGGRRSRGCRRREWRRQQVLSAHQARSRTPALP